jgi:hypothetical protein
MYGVVVCPRCRAAKGVDLAQKTTTCACGFVIELAGARILFETADLRELAAAVGRARAELAGGLADYETLAARGRKATRDVFLRVAARAARAGDKAHRIRAAARALSEELVVFTTQDLFRVFAILGVEDHEAALDELVAKNVVYEPRPGFYRAV